MHRIGVQHSTYIDKYQQKQLGTFLRRKQLKYFTAFMQMQIKRWSRTYTVSLVTAMKRSICSHSPNILESHLTIVLIAWHRCWTSVHVSYYINADKWSTCSQPSLILTRGPFQLSSAKYVQVKMVYRLTYARKRGETLLLLLHYVLWNCFWTPKRYIKKSFDVNSIVFIVHTKFPC